MSKWTQIAKDVEDILRLRTRVVGYKRLEHEGDLAKISDVIRINHLFSFDQIPSMARVIGLTIGITRSDSMLSRCMRIHGLKRASEKSMQGEAMDLASTWFSSVEDALEQQKIYPRIEPGEAIVVGPLKDGNFDPDVVLVYGNPAQIMMLMCGIQKVKYERFDFEFIGEGACADSVARCYNSGKPSLAIPCFGERAFGQVADDEIVLALPPAYLERAVIGLRKLAEVGMSYPIRSVGIEADISGLISVWYPDVGRKSK